MNTTLWVLDAIVVLCSITAAVLWEWRLRKTPEDDGKISVSEFTIGIVVIIGLVSVTNLISYRFAQHNSLTYNQRAHGWELSATGQTDTCSRNGVCGWTYSCNTHLCGFHKCFCSKVCNSEGKNCTETCSQCPDYCDDSCPYFSVENDYYVITTLGQYTVAKHVAVPPVEDHRYVSKDDSDEQEYSAPVPIAQLGIPVGDPAFWTYVRSRISEHSPGPVTAIQSYTNYVIAAQPLAGISNSLRDKLISQGVIPVYNQQITNLYHANQVWGVQLILSQQWQDELEHFNAVYNSQIGGDLSVVIVNTSVLTANDITLDDYTKALRDDWMNHAHYGANALGANATVAVVSSNGMTIQAIRMFQTITDLNSATVERLKQLPANTLPISPSRLFGSIRAQISADGHITTQFSSVESRGILEDLLFGQSDPSTKFVLPKMEEYKWMEELIEVDIPTLILIGGMSFMLTLGVWWTFTNVSIGE